MRTLLVLALSATLVSGALAADPQTDEQKAFYALGIGLSKQLGQLQPVTPQEIEFINAGLADALLGNKPKLDPEQYAPKLREIAAARSKVASESEKKKGAAFVEKAV